MAIPFNPPEPVYPQYGQALAGGLDAFVRNYALARQQGNEASLLALKVREDREREAKAARDAEGEEAKFRQSTGADFSQTDFLGITNSLAAGAGGVPYKPDLIKQVQDYQDRIKGKQEKQATIATPKPTAQENKENPERLLTLAEQAQYGLPAGSKLKDAFGRKPTAPARQIVSAETAKLIENAQSGLRALDDMEASIGEDPSVYRYAAGGQLGASLKGTAGQKYLTSKKIAADIVTRLRTGAALNAEEQKFYDSLSPGILDTPDSARFKVKQMRDFYSGIVKRLQAGDFQAASRPGEGGAGAPSGAPVSLTGDKAKRLEELRAKKAAGTLK